MQVARALSIFVSDSSFIILNRELLGVFNCFLFAIFKPHPSNLYGFVAMSVLFVIIDFVQKSIRIGLLLGASFIVPRENR